jgi:hypothetical protein
MKTLMATLAALLMEPALQDVDNPDYQRWASFKVGSWVKMKSEIEAGGNKMALPQELTHTLLELDDKKVVVEEVLVNTLLDKDSPKQEKSKKRSYKSTTSKKEAAMEGDEEIEIAGKKMKCHWVELKSTTASSKTWSHPDVPGGTVRMELTMASAAGKTSLTRLFATSWEKK